MPKTPAYKFDWYPYEWHGEHLGLPLELGGFLTLIKCLIGINNDPLFYDLESISMRIGVKKKKTDKLINILLEKEILFLTEDRRILHKRSVEEVENCKERIENSKKNGKINAEKRWENHRNQQDKNSTAIKDEMPNITSNTTNDKTNNTSDENLPKNQCRLRPETISLIERFAPNYDPQELIEMFWSGVEKGEIVIGGQIDTVFIQWLGKYTREKPSAS